MANGAMTVPPRKGNIFISFCSVPPRLLGAIAVLRKPPFAWKHGPGGWDGRAAVHAGEAGKDPKPYVTK
jgi:hypothetical protein